MIKEFDVNELRARPSGGQLLHGMKTVKFYCGDDHHRVSNIRVYGGMKVVKGKFGRFLELDLNEERKSSLNHWKKL